MEGQNEQTNDDLISKLKVIGKKSIWVTNKINLQWITKKTCF